MWAGRTSAWQDEPPPAKAHPRAHRRSVAHRLWRLPPAGLRGVGGESPSPRLDQRKRASGDVGLQEARLSFVPQPDAGVDALSHRRAALPRVQSGGRRPLPLLPRLGGRGGGGPHDRGRAVPTSLRPSLGRQEPLPALPSTDPSSVRRVPRVGRLCGRAALHGLSHAARGRTRRAAATVRTAASIPTSSADRFTFDVSRRAMGWRSPCAIGRDTNCRGRYRLGRWSSASTTPMASVTTRRCSGRRSPKTGRTTACGRMKNGASRFARPPSKVAEVQILWKAYPLLPDDAAFVLHRWVPR